MNPSRHYWTVNAKNTILVGIIERRIDSFLKTAHDPNEPEWMRRYFQLMADRYMALLNQEKHI